MYGELHMVLRTQRGFSMPCNVFGGWIIESVGLNRLWRLPANSANEPVRTSVVSPEKSCKNTPSPTPRAANLHAQRRRPL